MAELVLGVAKSLVEGTLSKAQAAIEEESQLRKSTQRDLVFITGEFQMMQSFLSATTEENVKSDVVKGTWVTQVRDLAYDVEDCIEFVVHLDTKPDWWFRLIPSFIAPSRPLDEAVNIIDLLKARVHDVSQRSARYNLVGISGPETVVETKKPAAAGASMLLAKAGDTAGNQQDLEALTNVITAEGSDLQVISLWVSGEHPGVESIIKKAYDDQKVLSNFMCRAWVKMPHPFNLHEFTRSLLDQFYANSRGKQHGRILGNDVHMRKKAQAVEDYVVQEYLQQVNNKKYLVVVEDISTMAEWDIIREYLPDWRNGSRIVVYTRHFEIASMCTGVPCFQWFSPDQPLCIFFKEDFEVDGDTGNTSNGGMSENNCELIGRMYEISELRQYPARARMNAFQVISVWGISGAGKSALVKKLYMSKVPQGKHAWLDVSCSFNLRDFCQKLLLQLHSCLPERNKAIYVSNGIRDPVQECHDILKDHPCLVVIDNLQSSEDWDLIEDSLIFRPSKSIFIVVTNEERVALHCADRKDLVFNVRGLEVGDAIDLFKKEVSKIQDFPVNNVENDLELRELVSKCGGLPKVIVSVAAFFAQVFNFDERARILNENFMMNLETSQQFAPLRDLFGWIHTFFRACPDFLKPCIFYLSIFPKSQIIRRRRLVMRWVAEGYSKDNASDTAEENGEKIFTKIVELSMIQPPERIIITNVRMVRCQVSAFFHEYIFSRPQQENVTFALEVFALKGCCRPTTGRTGRHLIIEENWERNKIVFENIDFSKLRSLTVFGKWESFFISESMKVLRVLDLEDVKGVRDEDLRQIPQLLPRLKFLSLRGCSGILCLPSSVGFLRQLQTLDIRRTSIVMLPESITKLKKLQYLRAGTPAPAPGSIIFKVNKLRRCRQLVGVMAESGVGKLTALHTLGVIDVGAVGGKTILGDVEKLSHLRKLGFSGISKKNIKEFCSAVKVQAQLESLSVLFDKGSQHCLDDILSNSAPLKNLQSLKLYGLVERLPERFKTLPRLKKLVLEITVSAEDGIRVLGELKELCILRLSVRPHDGKLDFRVIRDGVEDHSYEMLKVLEIACSSPLDIIFGSKVMKNLEQLLACCSSGLTLKLDELSCLSKLRRVELMSLHNDAVKQQLKEQLKMHPNKPVFQIQ